MSEPTYDYLVIGSGAGGCAAAHRLVQRGKRVLLLEKGGELPQDGSTLDVDTVMRRGVFKSTETWVDRRGRPVIPEEYWNLGGKTKWYGAALLRFSPDEFKGEPQHGCLPWPFGYDELEPFYAEAERLLGVRTFPIEPQLERMIAGFERRNAGFKARAMPLGLAAAIAQDPLEASRFDAFASAKGMKSDAASALLGGLRSAPNLTIKTGKAVDELVIAPGGRRVTGVVCADGTPYDADVVLLAAGALHSPRVLERSLARQGLNQSSPSYALIGRHYKCHINTAMLAFSAWRKTDRLRKTMLLTHPKFPHSSVQPLGGTHASVIVQTQLPRFAPRLAVDLFGQRAEGFFLTTEDGSHPDNRVRARADGAAYPVLDYDPGRRPSLLAEHRGFVRYFRAQLMRQGFVCFSRAIGLAGTAHACGTLSTGNDPARSVVDAEGRVHGMENLYVVDGSVLPSSSRANPSLTIYAWALRVASRL